MSIENYTLLLVYGNYEPITSNYIRNIVLNSYYSLINELRYIPRRVNLINFNVAIENDNLSADIEIDHLNYLVYVHVYF